MEPCFLVVSSVYLCFLFFFSPSLYQWYLCLSKPMTHSQNQQLCENGGIRPKNMASGYFAFDHLYTPDHHTQRIYDETTKGVVLAAMDGKRHNIHGEREIKKKKKSVSTCLIPGLCNSTFQTYQKHQHHPQYIICVYII
jgi:hypothetical protein